MTHPIPAEVLEQWANESRDERVLALIDEVNQLRPLAAAHRAAREEQNTRQNQQAMTILARRSKADGEGYVGGLSVTQRVWVIDTVASLSRWLSATNVFDLLPAGSTVEDMPEVAAWRFSPDGNHTRAGFTPAFVFDDDGVADPRIVKIWEVLAPVMQSNWELLAWLVSPNGELDGVVPLDDLDGAVTAALAEAARV